MKIIGIDIGTTSICGICYDTKIKKILKTITRSNNSFVNSLNEYEKIQDPKKIISIVEEIYDYLLESCEEVSCIGVTGQMHGIVYLDKFGNPISNLITWQDQRGNLIYKNNKTYVEYLNEISGYTLSTGYGSVTHFYNQENNNIPLEAVTFCTIHDLVVMFLTGNKRPIIHSSNAASIGFFDLKKLSFDEIMLKKAHIDSNFYPEIAKEYTIAGKTKKGIPVAIAIGDNQASFLGSVSKLNNTLLINVGTGSQISCVIEDVVSINGLECRPLVDGKNLLVGSALCGGKAYAILEKFLREIVNIFTSEKIDSLYSKMDKIMKTYQNGNNTLKVDTTFSGTRKNPEKRGVIRNIDIENFNVYNLCDAFMGGIVSELIDYFFQIKSILNNDSFEIIGSGNGIRFNSRLVEKFEEKFNGKMKIPQYKEEAAFGAALYGLKSAHFVDSIEEALQLVSYCK